jgi:hypothetical protein
MVSLGRSAGGIFAKMKTRSAAMRGEFSRKALSFHIFLRIVRAHEPAPSSLRSTRPRNCGRAFARPASS